MPHHGSVSAASSVWRRFLEGSRLGLPNPILFVIGYFALQAVLLTLTRHGASFDGAEQLVTAQAFEWGYGRSQPPVYTWFLLAIGWVVPQPLAAEHILKALLFIVGYSAIFLTARRIGLSPASAALAMFLTFLMPEIGWQAQTAYSHSTQVFAFGALLLLAYVHLSERSPAWMHAGFGGLAALALLSKFSAGFLILAMLAALVPGGRLGAIFLRRQALAGLAAFLLILAPHALWSLHNLELLFALQGRFKLDAYQNPLVARAVGLLTYLGSVLSFIGPLILVCLATVAPQWRLLRPATAGERQLWRIFFASLAIMALVPILSGASDFAPRWPLAALFPFGILVASLIDRLRPERVLRLSVIAAAIAMAFIVGINLRSIRPENRFQNDYTALLTAIEAQAGPVSSAAITDYPVLANLRVADPSLRLVMREFPFTARFLDSGTIYLWTGDDDLPGALEDAMREAGRDPAAMKLGAFPVSDSYGNVTSTIVRAAW